MANVRNANTWWVDESSASGTTTSFISESNIKIVGLLLTSAADTDALAIFDRNAGGASVGAQKMLLQAPAKDTKYIDFSARPIICPNGIWVTLTGTPKASLILSV
jgi:hypothetical protein